MKIEAIWRDDTQQQLFRQLLDAISRPGNVVDLSDALAGAPCWLGVLATFVDKEVALADLSGKLQAQHWPLLQVEPAAPEQADYVLFDAAQPCPDAYQPKLGTLEGPDQSATLVLVVSSLTEVSADSLQLLLSGPGVNGSTTVSVTGLARDWLGARSGWNTAFPMGVDLILTDINRAVCLPRTTQVEVL